MKKIAFFFLFAACASFGLKANESLTDSEINFKETPLVAYMADSSGSQLVSGGDATPAGDYTGVWKRTKSWGVGFVSSTLHQNGGNLGSEYGFATDLTKTYIVTKNPILDIMKVGIDAKWFDINYVKYKNEVGDYYDDDYDDYYDDEEDFDIGSHNLDIGMGVGPSLLIAPFAKTNNALKDLRADIFFHFTPSFSILTLKEEGDTNIYYGFNPAINFGVNVQWKMIGLGFEGRWGFPKYSNLNDMFDEYEYDEYMPTGKHSNSIKSSSFRFFLRLCF